MWRTRRWARDLPDLVVVGTPIERWSAPGKRRSRPAGAASLHGRARPPLRNPHGSARHRATRTPPQHRTARLGACRHHTPRHGRTRHAEHGTEHGTAREGETRQVSERRCEGWHTRRDSAGLARCGTPSPTQDGTAGLGTTRDTHPNRTGRRVSARHCTPSAARDTQHWTGCRDSASLGITARPARRAAWPDMTARHDTAPAIGVRRPATAIGASRRIRTRRNDRTPRRESDGAFWWTCGGVSRW